MNNTIDSQALLTQLRVMASRAGIPDSKTEKTGQTESVEFTEVLKESVEQVNQRKKSASALQAAFERGDTDVELSQVMIEMQKARISFETLNQVRNKVVSAYQEVMNMQI